MSRRFAAGDRAGDAYVPLETRGVIPPRGVPADGTTGWFLNTEPTFTDG